MGLVARRGLGLTPVAVRLDEEDDVVYLVAEHVPEAGLRLGLARMPGHMSLGEAVPDAKLCWVEPRQDFLRRWGRMWADFLAGESFDQRQWDDDPEPMRDMPWEELADIPEWEPPSSWSFPQRIAWFYLSMAHLLRSRGHGCEYTADPAYWTLRELAFARLSIGAAQSAWAQLRADAPPRTEARCLIDAARESALFQAEVSTQSEQEARLALDHAYFDAIAATFDHIAAIVDACLPYLPIGAGSFIADHEGRRAVILRADGRDWLLYWDDGRITQEDAFHTGRHPSCRWPVATGPRFDRNALAPIDARRLRFLELKTSPVCIVCPVCGYPCMDDDLDDVQSCDICGYEDLWQSTHGRLPALDATLDQHGEPITPTLRERRAFFLDHGDAWPAELGDEEELPLSVSDLRHPERRRLARQAMAEWDAWLEHPDPRHTPEEVWRRWNRWKGEQRREGGHDDA